MRSVILDTKTLIGHYFLDQDTHDNAPMGHTDLIFDLNDITQTAKNDVGGKAFNLTRMISFGLNVPGGFVLGVSFFDGWFKALKKSPAWRQFTTADESELEKACSGLRTAAGRLTFSDEQLELLHQYVSAYDPSTLFAVRSSSPEEDLEGASFAGAYESALGVPVEELEPTIRRGFFLLP